jgi:uncharacterized membrane protein YraQ (UPF0718 family)
VTVTHLPRSERPPLGLVVVGAAALWSLAWFVAAPLADWVTYGLLGLEPGSQLGETVAFFLLDVPKVLLLLLGVVTVVSFARSFFPPERVRSALAGRGRLTATAAAAGFGVVTPFCSCSAVPLFIGFVEAGIPLGVTFAFLISSPMVNEVALVLLWGLFGPVVALTYMAAGLAIAIGGGLVIGRLGMERHVEPYVWEVHSAAGPLSPMAPTFEERLADAWAETRRLVGRIWLYIVAGIGIGALIHGYVPTELVVDIGGSGNLLAVPMVVLLAVPLYSNAAGTLPIVQALLGKGLPLGTTLAFMMAVTAISLPELIILRRVMRLPLLVTFVGIVAAGILAIGYLFNAIM